jgi:hypothetical protein
VLGPVGEPGLAFRGIAGIVTHVTVSAAELIGGPHDGKLHEPPDPMPDTLFAISFDDGSRDARVGDRRAASSADVIGLFRFDPASELARRAMREMGVSDDTPPYGPLGPAPPRHG